MLWQDGDLLLKSYHWQRLWAGMEQLAFTIPPLMTPGWLEQEVARTVQKNNLEKLCRVRLQVYAGSGGMLAGAPAVQFLIECFPLDEGVMQLNENGLVLGIAAGVRKSADILANMKTANALLYALAGQEAHRHKW